jgi:hypothetical protein
MKDPGALPRAQEGSRCKAGAVPPLYVGTIPETTTVPPLGEWEGQGEDNPRARRPAWISSQHRLRGKDR